MQTCEQYSNVFLKKSLFLGGGLIGCRFQREGRSLVALLDSVSSSLTDFCTVSSSQEKSQSAVRSLLPVAAAAVRPHRVGCSSPLSPHRAATGPPPG